MRYNNPYYDDDTVERVLMHGHRLVDEMCTVRDVAKWSGFGKSTVHKDVVERLPYVNGDLAEEAQIVIELNTKERAQRGAWATNRYKKKKQGS